MKSDVSLLNLPNAVPPSFKTISAPSTSIFKSPPISKVKSPLSDIVEPLIVTSSTVNVVSVPNEVMFGWAAVVIVIAELLRIPAGTDVISL